MRSVGLIGAVFLIIYLKIIYALFFQTTPAGENFFVKKDSQSLNYTVLNNDFKSINGHKVRTLSNQINLKFLQPVSKFWDPWLDLSSFWKIKSLSELHSKGEAVDKSLERRRFERSQIGFKQVGF